MSRRPRGPGGRDSLTVRRGREQELGTGEGRETTSGERCWVRAGEDGTPKSEKTPVMRTRSRVRTAAPLNIGEKVREGKKRQGAKTFQKKIHQWDPVRHEQRL